MDTFSFLFTECIRNLNQSFGRLDISYSNKFDPYCKWTIGNAGIPQAVGIVSIHHVNFSGYGRYIACFFCSITIILVQDFLTVIYNCQILYLPVMGGIEIFIVIDRRGEGSTF